MFLHVRGVRYSAGRINTRSYPEWTGEVDLTPISEYPSGEEWRASYVQGTVHRWRVSLGAELPGHEPARSRFLVRVGEQEGVIRLLDSLPGSRDIEVEVQADTEEDAVKIGLHTLAMVKSAARRDLGKSGPFGMMSSVSARPLDS